MPEQVMMWKCSDGWLATSEAQANAYEVRRALEMLSAQVKGAIKINEFGQVDQDAAASIAQKVIDELQGKVDAVTAAVAKLAQPVADPAVPA